MRLSTQNKKDLKENVLNAKTVVWMTRNEIRKARNKNKAFTISFATDHQKPPNRKKHPNLRTPPEINRKANTSIARPCHRMHPEYIGLRKWKS